jgi:hypothetical protein
VQFLLQLLVNKNRKQGDDTVHVGKGAVTGHYISFLKATMDEMNQYPHMKGHYFVMDNTLPTHTSGERDRIAAVPFVIEIILYSI